MILYAKRSGNGSTVDEKDRRGTDSSTSTGIYIGDLQVPNVGFCYTIVGKERGHGVHEIGGNGGDGDDDDRSVYSEEGCYGKDLQLCQVIEVDDAGIGPDLKDSMVDTIIDDVSKVVENESPMKRRENFPSRIPLTAIS